MNMQVVGVCAAALLAGVAVATSAHAQAAKDMSFFVASAGKGDGANLGGLDGADAHCATLAKAAGSTKATWRAYLSTTAPGGDPGVNARDRIGKGPWTNAKGVVVAKTLDELPATRRMSPSKPRSARRAKRSAAAAIP